MIKIIKIFKVCFIGIFFLQVPSYADWQLIAENDLGIKYFFDSEYVSKKGDILIYQVLENHKVKTPGGYLTVLLDMQGNCDKFSIKWDKGEFSEKPFDFELDWIKEPKLLYVRNPEWQYPDYDSPWGKALKKACDLKL